MCLSSIDLYWSLAAKNSRLSLQMKKAKPNGSSLGWCVCFIFMSVYPPLRQVQEDSNDKNSVVSFTLTDDPQHIDLFTSNSKEEVSRPCLTGGIVGVRFT